MDHPQSLTPAMETEVAEIRTTMSTLTITPTPNGDRGQNSDNTAEYFHEYQESPTGGPRRPHSIHAIANQPRPCKASLLVDPGDREAEWPYLDSRFKQDRTLSGKLCQAFSNEFLWCAKAGYEFGREEFPMFILRHANAAECPVGEGCTHWQWISDHEAAREEESIDLQVVCISAETVEKGISIFEAWSMFEPNDAITCDPCAIFNALKPDFGVIRAAGYEVVLFRLVEGHVDDADGTKWMDQCGRLLARMD
ncbi:hypothetical protein NW762_013717 [Fusarium torreyae]|uniref:Uncharacterized protein n=1 Tax=Fusarium torreyae TaxID=1237075 RepID=A0A9W8RP17_9HYPO|nr:hypothetical protein NW762_013717 [Fusarium torreyae]